MPGGNLASTLEFDDHLAAWRQNEDTRIFENYGPISQRNRVLDFSRNFHVTSRPVRRAINTGRLEGEEVSFWSLVRIAS
ncbi:hypothetical protein AVEN_248291-1, partial [Araneus ventricosus]